MQLSGHTVLIAGGSTGIGLALAHGFLARGSRVLICARNEERLQHARTLTPALEYCVADVAIASDRAKLRDWIATQHPAMNVLVNNAGLQRRIDFASADTPVDFSEIMTNFAAPIALIAELRHQLRATGVRVVDIAPPAVDTELLRGAQDPGGRATGGPPTMTPEAFVAAALGALERGRTDIRIGGAQLLYLLNRLAPEFALRLLNRLAS